MDIERLWSLRFGRQHNVTTGVRWESQSETTLEILDWFRRGKSLGGVRRDPPWSTDVWECPRTQVGPTLEQCHVPFR